MNNEHDLKTSVMDAIRKRKVNMRPRWHFLLLSALAAAGVLILIVTLLYITSLVLFFWRDSGVWYATDFGPRGWFELLRSAPLFLILLVAIFAIVLEVLVRKYSFAYRTPLIASLGAILCVVFVGGLVLAQTSLHRHLQGEARHGHLPPPMGMWYGGAMRPPPPGDMYIGAILLKTADGFIIVDENGNGTSTVVVTPKTRLPYGEDFSPGDVVIVIGDAIGTGTIRAYGVRIIDDER